MNNRFENYSVESSSDKKVDRQLFYRLMSYLRPYWKQIFVAIFFLLTAKTFEAIIPIQIGKLAGVIMDEISLDVASGDLMGRVFSGGKFIFLILLITYFLDLCHQMMGHWVGQKVIFKMRVEIFEHIQKMEIDFFYKRPVGQLMTRTIHDVDNISHFFTESVVSFIGNAFLIAAILVGISFVEWKVALFIFVILPFVVLFSQKFRKEQRRSFALVRAVLSAMNSFAQEHLMGVHIIKNFAMHKQEKKLFEEINSDYKVANLQVIKNIARFIAGIEFSQNMILIVTFVLLMTLVTNGGGEFRADLFFTFNIYVLMLFRPIREVAERYNVLQSAIASGERIFSILDKKATISRNPKGKKLEKIETITFEEVSFAYEEELWVLKDLSFHLKKGESLALVGATGAGKTTITKLLGRLYDVQKGVIKINGIDIREYELSSLRSRFTVVMQDPIIFSGTIGENISLMNPHISTKDINRAIDYVGLREYVDLLEKGIDHNVFERGKTLSVGQMQLLSLARAIAHNSDLMILDEATANIDSKTEKMIQKVLKRVMNETTTVIVAHRLSTIQHADKILVFHQGEIKEEGDHNALLKKKGIYEKLYRLQLVV